MAVKLNVKVNRVTYKCFDCLRLKNPETETPHIAVIIANVRPNPAGQIDLVLGNALLCPVCYEKGEKEKKFIDVAKINQAQKFIDRKGLVESGGLN